MQMAPETGVHEYLERMSRELEGANPQEVLEWGFQQYHPDITLACSLGGVSGMALLDMAVKIRRDVEVFYLDTDFLFPETYALEREVERQYGVRPVAYRARWTPEEQARQFGEALWERDPDLCCEIRKVQPNWDALDGKRAWISGLRRDQSETRRNTPVLEWDGNFGLVKLNPLATWTEAQVWGYILKNGVPYNALHERGYPSIGCTFCTRAVSPGEDPRAGRWSGTGKVECGLHTARAGG